jgi:hypothetical protein
MLMHKPRMFLQECLYKDYRTLPTLTSKCMSFNWHLNLPANFKLSVPAAEETSQDDEFTEMVGVVVGKK